MSEVVKIAIPKGRIMDEALELFSRLKIVPHTPPDSTRKLTLSTNNARVDFLIVRAADVPTYVGYGAADLGIVGKDILAEYSDKALYELFDLNIARCQMVLAGIKGYEEFKGRRRIATKYIQIAKNYFISKGEQVEIIKLYGSMELAPILGLSDQIVDLVDTGNTLKANGLEVREKISDISAWLIANRASMKTCSSSIKPIIQGLRKLVVGE